MQCTYEGICMYCTCNAHMKVCVCIVYEAQCMHSSLINTHTHTQASILGASGSSTSSFVNPQLAALSAQPQRQSFIFTPPEKRPPGPQIQTRPPSEGRKLGENGGVPRGSGPTAGEGPKMVRMCS